MAANGITNPDDDPRNQADPLAEEFDDELLGLDPDDPEARAFAEHLRRQRRLHPSFTVEGYLSGMSDWAASANRLGGHRKLTASILVLLILLGVTITVWDALAYAISTFLR